jgi:rare lipoprotein A
LRALAAAAIACVLSACAPEAAGPLRSPGAPSADAERGGASYYADSLAGNATASGEPYDPRAMTAAHRTLPFGSVVEVVRDDGRRVRVRINDRGPFTKGRIIDLSRAAAEAIGMVREGVVEVTVVRVD